MLGELLKSPVLKADLLNENDEFRAKKKLEVYYETERIYKIQHYAKVAYQHLIKNKYINVDKNMYYYYFPNQSIFYHLGLNKNCKGFNIVGNVLSNNKREIVSDDAHSLFKGWYVIEMFVDIFCRKGESKYVKEFAQITVNSEDLLFKKVSIDEIYDRLEQKGLVNFDDSYIQQWFEDFEYKSWKHYFIFEHNQRYPNSFLPFIRKWYASSSYYFDNQNILKVLKSSIINRCNVENKDLMDTKDIEDNLLSLYNQKKMNLSDDDKIKIEKMKFEKYTTYEIKKMTKYLPDIEIHENMYYIYDDNKLSPLYKHFFTIENKKFVNVSQYIFYKLLCQVETSSKAYYLINIDSNYERILDNAINQFFLKQKMNDSIFTSIDNIILNKENEKSKKVFIEQFSIFYKLYDKEVSNDILLHKFVGLFYSNLQELLINKNCDIREYMNNFMDFDNETIQIFYNIMSNFEENDFQLLDMILKLEKKDIEIIYKKEFFDIINLFENKKSSFFEYKDVKHIMEYKDYLEIKKIEIKINS